MVWKNYILDWLKTYVVLSDWGVAAGGGEVQWRQDSEAVGEIWTRIFGINFNKL